MTMRWTLPEKPITRTRVLQIVISELPVPDDSHSIEDVLNFRDEMKQANLIQGLRVWMNAGVAAGTERLRHQRQTEYLVHEYAPCAEAAQNETGESEAEATGGDVA